MNNFQENNHFIVLISRWISKVLSPIINCPEDFLTLFFRREGIDILGKGFRSLWILISIMVLTFVAIGFSNGSLKYLEKKMSDPFINWINIDIPFGNSSLSSQIIEKLDNDSLKVKYGYTTLGGYYKYDLIIRDLQKNGMFRVLGRTIEPESPLLDAIFADDNYIIGRKFKDEYDIGFIVTENFLSELNYDKDARYIYIHYSASNKGVETDLPIPIIAIVKELPDKCSFATSPYFYNQRFLDDTGLNPFSPVHTKDLKIYVKCDKEQFKSYADEIEETISSMNIFSDKSPSIITEELTDSYINGYALSISFFPPIDSISELKDLFKQLINQINKDKNNFIQLYDYKTVRPFVYKGYDYVAVNFNSLDKIRTFKDFLYNTMEIDLEMSQIDSKETFNFVSKLTRFISLILLVFCTFSISLFLSNLLRNHLTKIRMNIGTFKAFGMSSLMLKKIYLSIIGVFITTALIFSILIASLIGYSGGIRAILFLLRTDLEAGQSYFTIIDWWTLIAIVSILFVSLYSISFSNNKLFNETPGNLVKNRD